jgi:hypothetical protein
MCDSFVHLCFGDNCAATIFCEVDDDDGSEYRTRFLGLKKKKKKI